MSGSLLDFATRAGERIVVMSGESLPGSFRCNVPEG
jgi:hypothetical protein